MNLTVNEQYNKISNLSKEIRTELRKRGFVIPVKNSDGSIKVGPYLIRKNPNNFYRITDHADNIIVDHINLPHTAAILANDLALGRDLDKHILDKDRAYGYAEFQDQLYFHSVASKKPQDYIDILQSKFELSRSKKAGYRQDIIQRFEKLTKIA
jgi:hypothetical protein